MASNRRQGARQGCAQQRQAHTGSKHCSSVTMTVTSSMLSGNASSTHVVTSLMKRLLALPGPAKLMAMINTERDMYVYNAHTTTKNLQRARGMPRQI